MGGGVSTLWLTLDEALNEPGSLLVVPDRGVARQRGVGNDHVLPGGPEHQTKPPASNQTPNQLIQNKPLLKIKMNKTK